MKNSQIFIFAKSGSMKGPQCIDKLCIQRKTRNQFIILLHTCLHVSCLLLQPMTGKTADPVPYALQGKSHLCIPFLGIPRPQSQFPHSCVCERFIRFLDWSTYFPAPEQADRSWKYINLSQIYQCRKCETENYNSVSEMTVSFLGIHKWEPDIYKGFSPALHLQCVSCDPSSKSYWE